MDTHRPHHHATTAPLRRPPARPVAAGRAAIVDWCARQIAGDRCCILDTETTGFANDDDVIDLAVVGMDGRIIYEALVRPAKRVPERITRLTGIADGHVRARPRLRDLWPAIEAAIGGRRVLIYNAPFDTRLIRQTLARQGLAGGLGDTSCLMRGYARYAADPRAPGAARQHSLAAACAAHGIPPGGHRALADCLATRALLVAMARGDVPRA